MKKLKILIVICLLIITVNTYSLNDWTVMIYMGADSAMEEKAIQAIDEMEKAQKPAGYEYIVLVDRAPGNFSTIPDWEGTRVYNIVHDTTVGSIASTYADWQGGEVNTGDPQTVIDFAHYCAANHEAEKYALFFWGEGDGWFGGVCHDSTSFNDSLTSVELAEVFHQLRGALGKPLEITGFDAGKMGMIEIASSMINNSNYMIGSEEKTPGPWPWEDALDAFVNNTDTEDIIRNICDSTGSLWDDEDYATNISGVKISGIAKAVYAIQKFARRFNMNRRENIEVLRTSMKEVKRFGGDTICDLYHLLGLFAKDTSDKRLEDLAVEVLIELYRSVVYNRATISTGSDDMSHVYGLSVYAPEKTSDYKSFAYSETYFSKTSEWNRVLDSYHNVSAGQNGFTFVKKLNPTSINVYKSSNGEYSDVSEDAFMKGYAYILGNYPYTPYQNEHYQLYMKFDMSGIDDADKAQVKRAAIYHWSQTVAVKEKYCLAYVNSAPTGTYLSDSQLTHLTDCYLERSSIEGRSLTNHVQNVLKGETTDNGLVIGYGWENTDCGYIRNFSLDNVYLTVEYSY